MMKEESQGEAKKEEKIETEDQLVAGEGGSTNGRAGLDNLVLEDENMGAAADSSPKVENILGTVLLSDASGVEISQSEQLQKVPNKESGEKLNQREACAEEEVLKSVIMEVEGDDEEDESSSVRELLDGIEARVEALRLAAEELRREQEELLGSLDEVGGSTGAGGQLQHLGEVDREEVNLEVARLVARVKAVKVEVAMVRSEGQEDALKGVEDKISDLVGKLQSGGEVQSVQAECKALLAACSEGEVGGANQKFEQLVLGCSAKDQKEVKGRLEDLLEQITALATSQI